MDFDPINDAYMRYAEIFKMKGFSKQGHILLSFDEWKKSLKTRETIMPADLPQFTKDEYVNLDAACKPMEF